MKRLLASLLLAGAAALPASAQEPPAAPPAPVTTAASAAPVAAADGPAISMDRIVAVVGNQTILWSDVLARVNQRRSEGLQVPTDSAGQMALAAQVTSELVDEELLLQKAQAESIQVTETDVAPRVDARVKEVRGQFQSETEYRSELVRAGFGTPDEFRRSLIDQARRVALQQRLFDKLRQTGKLATGSVSEADVTEAFEKNRAGFGRRPATVSFRQIIVPPRPTAAARATARAKAESLLVEIRKGGDFEQIAKRESMDESNRETGGDLGWNRRGNMVAEFDRVMFALPPGQVSPVVETSFGYHLIRVDRVQPAEVRARHILIKPRIDSADVARASAEADSVAAQWRAGAAYDSLAAKHHDPEEERSIPVFERAQLPPSYATAFQEKGASDIVGPFAIDDRRTGAQKFVVAEILTATEGGEYTVADLRETIREQLGSERAVRRLLDSLRKATYVKVSL